MALELYILSRITLAVTPNENLSVRDLEKVSCPIIDPALNFSPVPSGSLVVVTSISPMCMALIAAPIVPKGVL